MIDYPWWSAFNDDSIAVITYRPGNIVLKKNYSLSGPYEKIIGKYKILNCEAYWEGLKMIPRVISKKEAKEMGLDQLTKKQIPDKEYHICPRCGLKRVIAGKNISAKEEDLYRLIKLFAKNNNRKYAIVKESNSRNEEDPRAGYYYTLWAEKISQDNGKSTN